MSFHRAIASTPCPVSKKVICYWWAEPDSLTHGKELVTNESWIVLQVRMRTGIPWDPLMRAETGRKLWSLYKIKWTWQVTCAGKYEIKANSCPSYWFCIHHWAHQNKRKRNSAHPVICCLLCPFCRDGWTVEWADGWRSEDDIKMFRRILFCGRCGHFMTCCITKPTLDVRTLIFMATLVLKGQVHSQSISVLLFYEQKV